MAKQSIDALVEGGKATAAPPLGPALGPLGVNIGQVVAEINKKTESFKGMQVPVKVTIDTDTKAFEISVGTPPASSLILKEAGITKGSGNPKEPVAELKIEQIIKIAKMKEDNLLGSDLKAKVKEIIGTCDSMGIIVEGKRAKELIPEVNEGRFDKEITEEKTEISEEERKALEEERKIMAKDLEEKRTQFETTAKNIISSMEGKSRSEKKAKLVEAGIPAQLIEELLPVEEKKEGGTEKKEGEVKEGEAAPKK